jgi:hypothetical protein
MMISLGSQGLTPLPTASEGLAVSQQMSAIAAGHPSTLIHRNPAEDKARRLQEIIDLLKGRVTGRGIYREGIERLAQLAGFTHMWQDDTLAIAGTCVDLEITFETLQNDKVKDVILKIFSDESEKHKQEASDIIKANLEHRPRGDSQGPWSSLERFSHNLEHLGRMDYLSQSINCFEAIDGLYLAFQRIWEEESRRAPQGGVLGRLSQGSVGRPTLDSRRVLGLNLEYWAEKRQLRDSSHQVAKADATQIDLARPEEDAHTDLSSVWTARIDCEAGYPSLRVSKEWIFDRVFENTMVGGEDTRMVDLGLQVAWNEPPPTLVPATDNRNGPGMADTHPAEMKLTMQPEVRFKAEFEPWVLVPLSAASSIMNKPGLSIELDERKYVALDQALRQQASAPSVAGDSNSQTVCHRWERLVRNVSGKAGKVPHRHSYVLYSAHQIWCFPVRSIAFDHPKYLAELLPTLREYAMLWTLLKSIIPVHASTGTGANDTAVTGTSSTIAGHAEALSRRGIVVSKDNSEPRRRKLAALFQARSKPRLYASRYGSDSPDPLLVDVSLSLTSSNPPKPKLDVIWPLPRLPGDPLTEGVRFASLCMEVGPNGEIVVPSAAGLPFAKSASGLKTIAKVIGLCEDLGLTVEWVMEKLLRSKT